MAIDCFLTFTKPTNGAREINGEAQDELFAATEGKPGGIAIVKFSFGVENQTTIGSATGGAGSGKAKLKEFEFDKVADRSTPAFFIACASGGHYMKVMLYFFKTGGQQSAGLNLRVPFLMFQFELVYITDVSWSYGGDDEQPTETIKFVYGAMAVVYTPQKSDGTIDATGRDIAVWNQVKNNQKSLAGEAIAAADIAPPTPPRPSAPPPAG